MRTRNNHGMAPETLRALPCGADPEAVRTAPRGRPRSAHPPAPLECGTCGDTLGASVLTRAYDSIELRERPTPNGPGRPVGAVLGGAEQGVLGVAASRAARARGRWKR
jgi:hypothetical protein